MKKDFSWNAFRQKDVMVKCTGTDTIRNFIAQAEANHIIVSKIQDQLEIGKQEIVISCKIIDGAVYIAEPTLMFMTNNSPWLIDWAMDVMKDPSMAHIDMESHKEIQVPAINKSSRIKRIDNMQEKPKKQKIETKQETKTSCDVCYINQDEDNFNSAADAWDLMRRIYSMKPEDIIEAFGVPYDLLLTMKYEDVKKRYDSWCRFQRRDIVETNEGRIGIVIGEPLTNTQEPKYLVLFGDYSTGIFRGQDLHRKGFKAKNFC